VQKSRSPKAAEARGILGGRQAVRERIVWGADRLALPVTAFPPDLETILSHFGDEIIKPYAKA
jgi:hypothetical protein